MYTPHQEETRFEPSARPPSDSRSLTELFRHLAHEATALVRGEVDLAKAETSEKISQIQSGISSVATGGAMAFAGFIMLLWAATLFIDQWILEPWLSSLIVAAVPLLIGLIMVGKGRSDMKSKNLVPRRTAESLRRDKEAIDREMHRSHVKEQQA